MHDMAPKPKKKTKISSFHIGTLYLVIRSNLLGPGSQNGTNNLMHENKWLRIHPSLKAGNPMYTHTVHSS